MSETGRATQEATTGNDPVSKMKDTWQSASTGKKAAMGCGGFFAIMFVLGMIGAVFGKPGKLKSNTPMTPAKRDTTPGQLSEDTPKTTADRDTKAGRLNEGAPKTPTASELKIPATATTAKVDKLREAAAFKSDTIEKYRADILGLLDKDGASPNTIREMRRVLEVLDFNEPAAMDLLNESVSLIGYRKLVVKLRDMIREKEDMLTRANALAVKEHERRMASDPKYRKQIEALEKASKDAAGLAAAKSEEERMARHGTPLRLGDDNENPYFTYLLMCDADRKEAEAAAPHLRKSDSELRSKHLEFYQQKVERQPCEFIVHWAIQRKFGGFGYLDNVYAFMLSGKESKVLRSMTHRSFEYGITGLDIIDLGKPHYINITLKESQNDSAYRLSETLKRLTAQEPVAVVFKVRGQIAGRFDAGTHVQFDLNGSEIIGNVLVDDGKDLKRLEIDN